MSGNLNLKQLFDFFLQANIDKIWIKLMEMKIFFMIFIDEDQQTRNVAPVKRLTLNLNKKEKLNRKTRN